MSQKIFDNDLVVIHKNKFTLALNKPAYVRMCILDKVLMYEFHYHHVCICMSTYVCMYIFCC